MNIESVENTIADTKEESIKKALELLGDSDQNRNAITRPNISVLKILFSLLAWIVGYGIFAFLLIAFHNVIHISSNIAIIFALTILIFILFFKAKAIIVNFVLLYQKLAPKKLRQACLFTPSCSEYMLLAIEKYGTFKGFLKGCSRLARCHQPNGGVDYP